MDLKQLRQKYPEYNDMSDDEFTSSFHKKFYSDMSVDEFNKKIGYQKPDTKSSPLSDLWEGTKGTAAFAGDLLAGMAKLPAQAALAVGGKIADPSQSLQQTWENAAGAMEETFPSFTKAVGVNPETNLAYITGMKPFELYGKGVETLAEKGSFGNKDVQGALNILGNVAPIPFAGKGAKLAGKVASRLDPTLYNIEVDAANAKRVKEGKASIADIVSSEKDTQTKSFSELTNEGSQYELFDQPEMGRVANPYEAKLGDWRVDENGIPIKADLSMEIQNLQNPLQRNLWGDELEPVRNPVGQNADLFAENGQQQGTPLTQAIDTLDASVRREVLPDQLQGAVEPSGALEGAILEATPDRVDNPYAGRFNTQRGAIKIDALVPEKFLNYVSNWVKAGGNLSHTGISRMLDDMPTRLSKEQRTQLEIMFPETAAAYQKRIDMAYEMGDQARAERYGKRYDDALIADVLTTHFNSYGKGFNLDGESYDAKTGRYAGAVSARAEAEALLNKYSGRFNKQRGALFPNRKPENVSRPSTEDLKLNPKASLSTVPNGKVAVASKAMGLVNTPYNRIKTVDEVLKSPGKDLPGITRGLVDPLQSGIEGTLRHNPKNAGINFARTQMQEARNKAEQLSKRYLTDAKTGLNAQLNTLNTKEKTQVVQLMLELDKQQVALSDRIMDKAGFNDRQKAVANKMREASDALYAATNEALGKQGFDAFPYRTGHMPGNFGGAYKTLIGYTDDKGFHITAVAQADTKLGHAAAVKYYKEQNNPKYSTMIPMGRKNVSGRVYSSAFDGWADIVAEVAKHDPEFAETMRIAKQQSTDAVASLYDFHMHEKAKKGIEGSYGNRPWLDADTNTKEFLRGYIDYLEEGYRYSAYQEPLNNITKLTMNPEYRSSHPNTVKYLDKYVRHVTGNSLNPIGVAANWTIDKAAQMSGLGNSQFLRANRELAQASTLHMMGVFNPGFFLAQLTQWATGGLPEAAALRASLKQDPTIMIQSLQNTIPNITSLAIEANTGKVVKDVPPHLREAWKWGHENGLFTFSEVALAHQVLQSKLRRKVEPYLDWPIRLGEQATRPTIFLTFVDMFDKAGFKGEEGFLRAQAATDWAMVNYHPDERPMLYQSLGALGNSLGALTTYKHNLVSQQIGRLSNKEGAAALTSLGLMYALYGVSGLPGYQEASDLAEKLTDKPLRELVLPDSHRDANSLMDGLLSAKTGLDFQSRLSMSSVLPDSPMSAMPHINNFVNIMDKAYDYAKNRDVGSFQEAAKAITPAGLKGVTESQLYPDGNVVNKEGKNKYNESRTKKEEVLRSLLGVRPLRERLTDERVWSNRISEAKRQDKLKDAQMRFDRAFLKNDNDGMAKADDDYTSNGGDPSTLYSSNRLKGVVESASMSEEQRRAGKPTKNLNTLKRYEEFTN